MNINAIREHLTKNLIGQDQFIDPVLAALSRYNGGLHWSTRPAGKFMLLGKTGTGKTFSVETLATALHGSSANMITIHCGEYQLDHEVAKLSGAPPGYLGHRETQSVLSAPRLANFKSPNCGLTVILFDEIEKASPALFRLLLGILEKGEMRTGDNNLVAFQNTMIFFTSNLGVETTRKGGISYLQKPVESADSKTHRAVSSFFSMEFINRIDEFITFKDLTREDLRAIINLYAREANGQFSSKVQGATMLQLTVSPAAEERLIERGYDSKYGARELRRVWEREVITPLASFIAACSDGTREWPVLRLDVGVDGFEFTQLSMMQALAASIPFDPAGPPDSLFSKPPKKKNTRSY
jgi:ATP-dependent Clp protease ATP-binding subunit ClpA